MKFIDFRSDTVTQPTLEMREAMYNAVVGDDVYEDDPTVKVLETLAAKMVGKEAALFVPSGTFGNQLAVLTHTKRGDEVIMEANCHIKKFEVGATAVISGVQLNTIEGTLGKMDLNKVKAAIRGEDIHYPLTSLICLENATGIGTVLDLQYMKDINEIAKNNNLNIHLDGARVFNAATALNVDAKDICQYVDSVMFCLSKGLCSPVGSMLAGSKEFITRARKNRKLMGGGLRQAGVLAACGLISLEKMTKRLAIDHENAKYLANQIETIPGFKVCHNRLDINMVFVTIDNNVKFPSNYQALLLEKGIKVNGYRNGDEIRFVTHNDINKQDIDYLIYILKEIIGI
ncbi:MAG: ltaE [Haloplasmataceae bacterium]|jgi:threonine aldolase|nr:ltaE [Haloplasmataceae bacterium]